MIAIEIPQNEEIFGEGQDGGEKDSALLSVEKKQMNEHRNKKENHKFTWLE